MGKNTTVGQERKEEYSENPSTSYASLNSIQDLAGKILTTGKYRMYWEYLEWLGLSEEPNPIILSPNNHYYYDDEELREVKLLVNLKHLNYIKQLKEFLYTVNKALSNKSYLIGSFIERKNQFSFFSRYPDNYNQEGVDPVENGISSRIPLLNMIYDLIDLRTNNRNMTRKSVTILLELTGFKLLDMTEINGVTCFCAQKKTPS